MKDKFQKLQHGYNIQSEIIKYTPGGMHVCYLSDPIHLEYASDGLCRMLDYTRDEFELLTNKKYINNIIEEDRQLFLDFVVKLSTEYTKYTVEYRMIKKDGTIITVSDAMESKMCADGIVRGYSSVTDISKQKAIAIELQQQKEKYENLYNEIKQSEARFRMISSFSGIMFYEYHTIKQKYIALENVEKVLLYSQQELQVQLKGIKNKDQEYATLGGLYCLFHKDDQKLAQESAKDLRETGHSFMELRIMCGDYQYHWFLIDVYLSDRDKNVTMGCLRNIDERHQQLESLKLKTMLDPMTNLMNKVSAFDIIDRQLSESESQHALMFFDVDNFKAINDQLGHEVGDRVICYIADILKRTFRKGDILVRYGGDEFVVFMKDIKKKEVVFKRAKEIKQVAKECPYLIGSGLKLTFSIGVAFAKENSTARTMCIEADEANYKVKRNGKDGVYNKEFSV